METKTRVHFYSADNLSCGFSLNDAEDVIRNFELSSEITDINEIIELYNIKQFFKHEIRLEKWTVEHYQDLSNIVKQFDEKIGRFFGSITDQNIRQYLACLDFGYIQDFWELVNKYQVYKRIPSRAFSELIVDYPTHLHEILEQNWIVSYFDQELSKYLSDNVRCAELLISEFICQNSSSHKKLYFPASLTGKHREQLILLYIQSSEVNPNYLRLVAEAQPSVDLPLSDKTRLQAQELYENFTRKFFENNSGMQYGVSVIFSDTQEEPYIASGIKNGISTFSFGTKWILENQDYPTLMNNFIYIFGYSDFSFRSCFPSVPNKLSTLERYVFIRDARAYPIGIAFNIEHMLYNLEMQYYRYQLQKLGIKIESIFKWFFESYLPSEFMVDGFTFNEPSESTTNLEKCRLIASEIDRILKQFKLYVEEGSINTRLLEMSSSPVKFDSVPSLIKEKYIYASSEEITKSMFLLFSDQSGLAYTKRTRSDYHDLYALLANVKIAYTEFARHQQQEIDWLISQGFLYMDTSGFVCLFEKKCDFLRDLDKNQVSCKSYLGRYEDVLSSLCSSGGIVYKSSLFSEPEQAYLNYRLNKSKFCNGDDLRNSYIHGTHTQDPSIQEMHYLEFLKILVLIIIKINEEFDLRDRLSSHTNEIVELT